MCVCPLFFCVCLLPLKNLVLFKVLQESVAGGLALKTNSTVKCVLKNKAAHVWNINGFHTCGSEVSDAQNEYQICRRERTDSSLLV